MIYHLQRVARGRQDNIGACIFGAGAVAGTNVLTWHGGSKSENPAAAWIGRRPVCRFKGPLVDDVESGIDRVIALFKQHRLFVFDSCLGLLDELGTYSREVDEFGNPSEKIKDKEKYHRLDALRYLVLGITSGQQKKQARSYSG